MHHHVIILHGSIAQTLVAQASAPLQLTAPLPADILSIVRRAWPALGDEPGAWPRAAVR